VNKYPAHWAIDGFRVIANPPSVFHATVVLSRASKKTGFIVWLKKESRKGRPKNNYKPSKIDV